MSGRQLNETELARFHQLLSHLVRSQVPLPEALHQLSRDLDGWTSQAATKVARSLEEGQSLSAALAAHGGFPALYLELVAAGEQSGDLGQVLAYLARYAANRSRMQRQFRQSLVYPMFVSAGALGVLVYLLVAMRGQMQTLVRSFARSSGPIAVAPPEVWGGLLVMICGVLTILVLAGLLIWSGRLPGWGYRTPVVGRALRQTEASVFCQALGLLVNAGSSPEKALELAGGIVGWPDLRGGIRGAAAALAGGEAFPQAIERISALPRQTRWLLGGAWSQGAAFPELLLDIGAETEQEALEQARFAGLTLEISVLGLAGFAVFLVAVATYAHLNAMIEYLMLFN